MERRERGELRSKFSITIPPRTVPVQGRKKGKTTQFVLCCWGRKKPCLAATARNMKFLVRFSSYFTTLVTISRRPLLLSLSLSVTPSCPSCSWPSRPCLLLGRPPGPGRTCAAAPPRWSGPGAAASWSLRPSSGRPRTSARAPRTSSSSSQSSPGL